MISFHSNNDKVPKHKYLLLNEFHEVKIFDIFVMLIGRCNLYNISPMFVNDDELIGFES